MFDIISADAEDQISKDRNRTDKNKKQDIDFLRDQRNERSQIMSKFDNRYAKKIDAKIARNASLVSHKLEQDLHLTSPNRPKQQPLQQMPTKFRPRTQNAELKNVGSGSDDDLECSTGQYVGARTIKLDPDYKPSPFLRENRRSSISLAKDPATLQALDRENVSSRGAARILAPAIAALGGDILKSTFSHRTFHCKRIEERVEVDAEIRATFQIPKHLNVHFDGKCIWDNAGGFGDHLAILVSGNSPDCLQGKLLSAKLIKDGTGLSQANEVLFALNDWGVKDNVFSMCFDTTSSNTGWLKGACVRIEKGLLHALLWLACRHHIPELFLKAAWQELFGVDMSPSYTEFENFKAKWDTLDKNNFKFLDPKKKPWMKEQRNIVVAFISSLLKSEKQPRDDYKECLELVLIVLGDPPEKFSFKKPGAYNKARWMAPLIYGLKMYLFRAQLSRSRKYHEKLERFAIFVCLYYAMYWFTAPIAAEAPYMDLQFYKHMLRFQKYDSELALAVLNKFLGHTWYLNQELVPLNLFSKNVGNREKEQIAKKLTKVIPPKKYECGYPNPVTLPRDVTGLDRELSHSIMNGSLFIFDVLGFKKDWLYKPVAEWEHHESFCEMKAWVQNLKVTNDCTERGVKLISEYAKSLTKDSVDIQKLIQVVENHRKMYPDVKKTTLAKNLKVSR